MLTLEQIADLDRRGKREELIAQLMYLEALGRISVRHEIWPFGKGYRKRRAMREQVSEELSQLLRTPTLVEPVTFADVPYHSPQPVYSEVRRLLN